MSLRMIAKRIAKYRFGLTLALLFALQLAVIAVFLLFLSLDLEQAPRALLGEILLQQKAMLVVLAFMLLFVLGFGLKALFSAYLVPLARLTEETVLLAANPRHRLAPQGAREVRALIDKLNDLAAAHQALRDEGQARIDMASRSLAEEKNRLAALMSELALSVLVCNIDGRILLYNIRAKQLLSAGHDAGAAANTAPIAAPITAPIGLGRSVFGVIERGLIVHALEQIQHQLRDQSPNRVDPVAGFVATLPGGQLVRAQMAPVLDDRQGLNGFVLTLEDITRKVEAESRRDEMLQSLSQDTRAALANIRAAVETMQTFPEMGTDKQAQLTAVIDDESQRLAQQIDQAEQQHGEVPDSHWELEEMRGADLLALLQRRIDAPSLRVIVSGTIDTTQWLDVDSYALTLALTYLARRLADEGGVREVHLGLQRTGRLARLASLSLSWDDAPLAAETLRTWENEPMQMSSAGVALTLKGVVAHHGGETVYRGGPPNHSSYSLLLPVVEPRVGLNIPQRGQGRPEFYDFDLFHQSGQNAELDQRPLSQIAYTVFDTETTGLQPAEGDEIISIGALRIVNGRLLQQESFDQLVRPRRKLSAESITVHGISEAMLEGQPRIEQVLPQFQRFAEDTVLVAHNAAFDMRFLQMQEEKTGVIFNQPVLDTLLLSQVIHPNQPQHTLEAIAARLGVAVVGRHTALGDAFVTGEVFLKMIPLLAEKGIFTFKEARDAAQQTLYARIRY
jgi:DNA polymerase III subunit epsilon